GASAAVAPRQGRAGVALFVTTIASFVGGSIGILLMIFLTPLLFSSISFVLDESGPPDTWSRTLHGAAPAGKHRPAGRAVGLCRVSRLRLHLAAVSLGRLRANAGSLLCPFPDEPASGGGYQGCLPGRSPMTPSSSISDC